MRSPAILSARPLRQPQPRSTPANRSTPAGPAITPTISAASSTHRAIGPSVDNAANELADPSGTRPKDGLNPTTPLQHAGMRIEPPPSVASDSGPIPRATGTAEAPLLPPPD